MAFIFFYLFFEDHDKMPDSQRFCKSKTPGSQWVNLTACKHCTILKGKLNGQSSQQQWKGLLLAETQHSFIWILLINNVVDWFNFLNSLHARLPHNILVSIHRLSPCIEASVLYHSPWYIIFFFFLIDFIIFFFVIVYFLFSLPPVKLHNQVSELCFQPAFITCPYKDFYFSAAYETMSVHWNKNTRKLVSYLF